MSKILLKKRVWIVFFLLIWWLLYQCVNFFLKPEIIVQNNTKQTIYVSNLQTFKWGDFDYDEYKDSLIEHEVRHGYNLRLRPKLNKITKNIFSYFNINWRVTPKKVTSIGNINFIIHPTNHPLFSDEIIEEEKQIERNKVSVLAKKTACRIRIIVNENDYKIIPENKWFCIKKLTPIDYIQPKY